MISDCLPLVQHLLHKAEIKLVRADRARRLVLMNRTELQQVAVNLIVNAIHAVPKGGVLTIRILDQDFETRPGVRIDIADTGVGMTPELIGKIFDPFFTTKRQEGTGLGLSISQRLIARQNGQISVQSEPGEGTTFSIWLPEAN